MRGCHIVDPAHFRFIPGLPDRCAGVTQWFPSCFFIGASGRVCGCHTVALPSFRTEGDGYACFLVLNRDGKNSNRAKYSFC